MSTEIGSESPEYADFDSDVIFSVEFASCHIFRQLLEFLNPTMENLPIFFGKDEISMICKNGAETLFFQGSIDVCNLTDYYLSPLVTREDENASHVINVNIARLLKSVKDLPKKGIFRISQRQSDLDNIILTAVDHGTDNFFRLLHIRDEDISISFEEENPIPSNRPNRTVNLQKFSHFAASSSKSSSRSSYIRCYPHGVDMLGTTSDKGSGGRVPWGPCPESERICDIKVGAEIMKSMAKLSTLFPEGIVRFYCNDPDYMRLEIPIAVLGTAFIYIRKAGGVVSKKD